MRPIRLLLSLLFAAAALVTRPAAAQQAEPRFFAPGTITVGEATTYRPSFTPDGRTVVYSLEVGADYVLLQSHLRQGRWSAPEVLPFSGTHSDAEAVFSPDGSELVFASRRPRPGTDAPRADYDLWRVERLPSERWGTPRHIEELGTDAHELYPALTRGGTLYFTRSTREGADLWRAERSGARYLAPEPLAAVNTDRREAGTFVDADERVLFFESNRDGGLGGTDLYVSCRAGGQGWSAPRALPAPLNSAAQETSAVLSPDGRVLYFTSNRRSAGAAALGPGARYADLLARLRQPGNGHWHIYHVPAADWCGASAG